MLITIVKEAEKKDLLGTLDRSHLRKQKEKALRMLDEEKTKVMKLKQMLADKKNEENDIKQEPDQGKNRPRRNLRDRK